MSIHSLNGDDDPVRARIPADLDTADHLVAGFTAGQVLTLLVLGSPVLLLWQALAGRVSTPLLLAGSIPVLAGALALVLARRDGSPLDRWLLAGLRYRIDPKLMQAAADLTPGFGWEPEPGQPHSPETDAVREGIRTAKLSVRAVPAPLVGVTEDGVLVHADGRHSAVIACTTIPTALSTSQDDAILAAGMARWLNSLSGPVQIVVRNRPANLAAMATALTVRANRLDNPALAELALDHAETLLDAFEADRPLHRTVVIACSGGVSTGPEQTIQNLAQMRRRLVDTILRRHRGQAGEYERHSGEEVLVSARASAEALSRARRTAGELQSMGARAQLLDGEQVQQVLVDVWTPCLLPATSIDSGEADPVDSVAGLSDANAHAVAQGVASEAGSDDEAGGGWYELPEGPTWIGEDDLEPVDGHEESSASALNRFFVPLTSDRKLNGGSGQ